MGEHPAPPPQDYATPQDRLAGQDWSGVAKTGLASMAPAEKGWLLGLVIMFTVMFGLNYMEHNDNLIAERSRSENLMTYLKAIEANRQAMNAVRATEMRRMQEINKELAQTVSRQANRAGRSMTSQQAVDQMIQGTDIGPLQE